MRWTRERRARQSLVRGGAGSRAGLARKRYASGARTTHAKRPVSSTFEGCVRGPEKIIGGHGSRTMKSCGPGASQEVLSLRKSATSCAGDGGKQEPAHRGEREVSVKTIAQGKPGVPSVSASACARTFFLRARLWVQWAPGFLCTLFY